MKNLLSMAIHYFAVKSIYFASNFKEKSTGVRRSETSPDVFLNNKNMF